MSPYQSRTPWVVLLLILSAALLGVAGLWVWDFVTRPEPAAPQPAVAADQAPVAAPRPNRTPAPKTRHRKAARTVSGRAAAPTPAPTPAPTTAPAALPELAAEAAPGPAAEAAPVAAEEPAPVQEPFSAPPLLPTQAPPPPPPPVEAAPAPAPEPAPAAPAAAAEADDAPLSFDGNGEEIARAIANAKRRAVQACFEHELKRAPTLHGTVHVELELAPPQRVNDVRVSDDLEAPELTRCIAATMQHLNFVGLNEEVTVHVPYVLSPRSK